MQINKILSYEDSKNLTFCEVSYNYKYNGKELQETGMYDYGARFYMPDVGRWAQIDPLALLYHANTPYNCTLNNPVYYKDPDGRRVVSADEETQKTVLAFIAEQFGQNNSFYFNKKGELSYKNSTLNKLSKSFNDEQKSLANGLKNIIDDQNKTIEILLNEDSDNFKVNYYEPGFVMETSEDGKQRYAKDENGVPKRAVWQASYQVDLNTSSSEGASFWAPGKLDNTKQAYGYVVMNKSTISTLQIEGEKGQLTVPSASSVFFHEVLDHGLDFIKNGNVNKSRSSGVENVYFHNQALKNISNGKSPLRISHYDTKK